MSLPNCWSPPAWHRAPPDKRVTRLLAFGCAVALASVATPAAAHAVEWSGEIALTTDYRYRGLSLSDGKPALQAGLTYEHSSGLYVDLWGSTLGAHGVELDPAVGYSADLGNGISADVSATYYVYTRDGSSNALETTLEVAADRGEWTLAGGAAVASPQRATRDEWGNKHSNLYVFAKAGYALLKRPLTVRGEIGRECGPWDMRDHGAKWNWTVGVDWKVGASQLSIEHVGSNAGSGTVVGSVRLTF